MATEPGGFWPWLWLTAPLLPLLAIPLLMMRARPAGYGLALTVLPMVVLSIWPQGQLVLPEAWPSASWGVDDLQGRTWLSFTAVLWGAATLYAVVAQRTDSHERRFWVFWLLALSGNALLIIARDGVSFYIGFTVMSLSAYGLVVHSGKPAARRAGLLYLQLAILGEMVLLAGLAMRAYAAGITDGNPVALDFQYWQGVPIGPWALALALLGLGIKAGFWPLHIWLPQAHPAAPAAASAVLSGAMIKAGILGLWRFLPAGDAVLQSWAPALVLMGLGGALLATGQGLFARRPKAILAWSSVSQMGYLLAILAAGWWWPEARPLSGIALAVYACHHALAKGALFLGAGMASSYRLGALQWALLVLPALALAGVFFTSGALAKSTFKDLFSQSEQTWMAALLSVAGVLTALLLLHFLVRVRALQRAHTEPGAIPAMLSLTTGFLALATLVTPWLIPMWRTSALAEFSLAALWASSWPVLAALALFVGAGVGPSKSLMSVFARVRAEGVIWTWLALHCRRLMLWRPKFGSTAFEAAAQWRPQERRWNRFWRRATVMPATVSLLCVLMLLGWLW